jgi:hypothetical protein
MECVDCGGRGACRAVKTIEYWFCLDQSASRRLGVKRGGAGPIRYTYCTRFRIAHIAQKTRGNKEMFRSWFGVFWSLCRMCLPGWFVALWRSTEESAATAGTLPICKNGILEQYATNDVDRVFIFSSKRHEFVLLGGTTEPTKTHNAPCSAARLRLLGHFLPSDAETQDFRPTTSTQASAWFWEPSRISCITMHNFL